LAAFVLTQPLGRVEAVRDALRSHGHSTFELSFSALSPRVDGLAALGRIAKEDFDRVVFVSPAAAAFAAPVLGPVLHDHTGVAAVGAGTGEALRQTGILASGQSVVMPPAPPYDADALFPLLCGPDVASVAVVKGTGGRKDWLDRLRATGRFVQAFEIYDSRPVAPAPGVADELVSVLDSGEPVVWLLSSRGAIHALLTWQPLGTHLGRLLALPAIAVHPNVAEAARAAGFVDVRLPDQGQTLLQAALAVAEDPSNG
jgi:uroporphyrinogen-III synthase